MFHDVNWLAVLAAGAAWWVLGSIWYTVLFGKKWAVLTGVGDNPTGNMPFIFGMTFVLETAAAAFLAGLMHLTDMGSLQDGLHLGVMLGVFIVLPVTWINYLYQRKSFALTAIDAGHMTVGLALAGLILGAWR